MKEFALPLVVVSTLSSYMTEVVPLNVPWWNLVTSVPRLVFEQFSPWRFQNVFLAPS